MRILDDYDRDLSCSWSMVSDRPRLNQGKTQHTLLGSRALLPKIDADSIRLRFLNAHCFSSVRGFGPILDLSSTFVWSCQ